MKDHRAKSSLRAAAVLALGLSAAALPSAARAQFFGGWGGWDDGAPFDGMAPRQVRRAIAERGFRVLSPLRRNGNVFVADVVDQRGQHERLIVAAADAQILQRFLIDDGRQPGAAPRGADGGRGFAVRGSDDDRGLVPPVDIPDAGRRFARPVDRDPAPQRFGDLGGGDDGTDQALPDAGPRRLGPPPIKTVKPHPRVVSRVPEGPAGRDGGAVDATPLAPSPSRPAATPVAKAPAPAAAPPAVVASRPEPATTATVGNAPSRHRADPLAIPGDTDAAGKPVRSVASGITGTPAPAAPRPSAAAPLTPAPSTAAGKPGDVPVAPLD